jgi:hypothetical protein
MHRRYAILLWLAVILLLGVLFAPSLKGISLLQAAHDVNLILEQKGVKNEYAEIVIDPSRYSLANIFSHSIASDYLQYQSMSTPSEIDALLQKALIEGHGPSVAQAISSGIGRRCIIRASAQAFDSGSGVMHDLALAIPERRAAWRYVLLHEAAHCNWNIALFMENRIRANEGSGVIIFNRPDYLLARHIGEAYADAYAMMMLNRLFPEDAPLLLEKIASWRNLTTRIGTVHRTSASIACAETISLQERDAAIRINLTRKRLAPSSITFAKLHQRAVQCARFGAISWFAEQGISSEEAAHRLTPLDGLDALPPESEDFNENSAFQDSH